MNGDGVVSSTWMTIQGAAEHGVATPAVDGLDGDGSHPTHPAAHIACAGRCGGRLEVAAVPAEVGC